MRRRTLAEFLRRLAAVGSAALVLTLGVFAASPELHNWLHTDDGDSSDDGCAVVLFASGVSVPFGAVTVAAPSADWRAHAVTAAEEIFLASPRYLRQPERGPPVS